MKQFWTILNFEFKNYFKNKVFVGVTLFLVILIAGVMCFPRISESFQNEEAPAPEGEKAVMLIAADADTAPVIQAAFAAAFPDYEIRVSENGISEQIRSGEAKCAFVFDSLREYTYYVNNLSMYDQNAYIADEVLQGLYRMNAMVESGLSPEEAAGIMTAQITHKTENLGKDQMNNFFYTYIMIMALYMVILMYGQMVSTNVATEKSSRAMEVLITSAKPTSMMFGKVIASCMAGLIQLVAVFGSAYLFYNMNKGYWEGNEIVASIFNMPLDLLLYMLLFFVLGFFIYAFLYGAVGSTVSKLEDINTAVMPITLLFIIAFIVVMTSMGSGNIDNALMVVCSYIPFTSPMAMFTRLAMSTVAWYEIAISVGILIGSVVVVGILAAKIYRVGVLLYGNKPKLSSILKSIWKA